MAEAMVICHDSGGRARMALLGPAVRRASELVGARPVNAPTAGRLGAMTKLLQRLALYDLLLFGRTRMACWRPWSPFWSQFRGTVGCTWNKAIELGSAGWASGQYVGLVAVANTAGIGTS